jgi:hypothetical protein
MLLDTCARPQAMEGNVNEYRCICRGSLPNQQLCVHHLALLVLVTGGLLPHQDAHSFSTFSVSQAAITVQSLLDLTNCILLAAIQRLQDLQVYRGVAVSRVPATVK